MMLVYSKICSRWPFYCALFFSMVSQFILAHPAVAQLGNVEQEIITFTNGLSYEGKIVSVPELGTTMEDFVAGPTGMPILMIDEGLRRIFLRKRRDDVVSKNPVGKPLDIIKIEQIGIDRSGATDSTIDPIITSSPFDQWGRRTITLATQNGPETFTQGITLLTPRYCELEVLRDNIENTPKKEWKMHISTKSLPVEVIRAILLRQIDTSNFDDRLRIVRFLVQAELFKYARIELAAVVREYPGLEQQLLPQYVLLVQAEADQSMNEIRTWKDSGNFELALGLLDILKKKSRLSPQTLADMNEIRTSIADENKQREALLESVRIVVDQVNSDAEADPEAVSIGKWLNDDLEKNLNQYNVNRLASFDRLKDDATMSADKKLSLAVSGWIIGSPDATDNLAVSVSLTQAKPLVENYLGSASPAEREAILKQLSELEAGDPSFVSKIVAHILPPVAVDLSEKDGPDPLAIEYEIPAANRQKEKLSYLIQLPPNYNPYRRYPCIVSLCGVNTQPVAQIGWWAGDYRENFGMRLGLAARNGYIVIAPQWKREGQLHYEYTSVEHARVLAAVRSALRRFSIDSDRVFLSGHFEGGDAAWDIGMAHPDHWAGLITISADVDKYVRHYKDNARYVPTYFVYGERDVASREANKDTWNRYLKGNARDDATGIDLPAFDTFIVEYKGRGAEDFIEELVDLYRWMNVKKRKPDEMKSFACSTMRSTDDYFWWLELHGIKSAKLIHPDLWDITKRKSDLEVSSKIEDNKISIRGDDENATIWLSPDRVDFAQKIQIESRFNEAVQPSTRVLLEDVRTRADRQHPFWARVDMVNNRWQILEDKR